MTTDTIIEPTKINEPMKLPSAIQIGDPVCISGKVSSVRFTEGKVRYDVEFEDGGWCNDVDSCFVGLAVRNTGALEAEFCLVPITEREEIAKLVRDIHEVMKRGTATADHGVVGNLRCILDHACSKHDPKL